MPITKLVQGEDGVSMETATVELNKLRISAWAEVNCLAVSLCDATTQGKEDVWRREGLWKLSGDVPEVKVLLLIARLFLTVACQDDFFKGVDFTQDALVPFFHKFATAISDVDKQVSA